MVLPLHKCARSPLGGGGGMGGRDQGVGEGSLEEVLPATPILTLSGVDSVGERCTG